MLLHETLPWSDPVATARGIPASERCWALLHSSLRTPYTGRYSILALKPRREITGEDFEELEAAATDHRPPFENAWFGYLGYGLKHALECLPKDTPSKFPMPALWMVHYALILVFDHDLNKVDVWSEEREALRDIPHPVFRKKVKPPAIRGLGSNMDKAAYFAKVETIREAILRGDLSQANLTRKFQGEFAERADALALFETLCRLSPAPYSSFLKFGDVSVISSSPERFLALDAEGNADSRPIKGSAPRHPDNPAQDKATREELAGSEKDRAENLMIVDLMRNDFSRGCIPGSVRVDKLFEITSYATLHHLSSTILGKKHPEVSALEFIKNCFPPGSMTGTPKIEAMKLCTTLEGEARGVYSGAIGWLGGDGSADFAVVIRTLITDGLRFEFQVGGAIVADSTAKSEWQETLVKARALAATLGINMEELEGI